MLGRPARPPDVCFNFGVGARGSEVAGRAEEVSSHHRCVDKTNQIFDAFADGTDVEVVCKETGVDEGVVEGATCRAIELDRAACRIRLAVSCGTKKGH